MKMENESMIMFSLALIGVIVSISIISSSVRADTGNHSNMALIILSNADNNTLEESKAVALYDHLLERGYSSDCIIFLASEGVSGRDESPTYTNIENSFHEINDSLANDGDIIVYISDHERV